MTLYQNYSIKKISKDNKTYFYVQKNVEAVVMQEHKRAIINATVTGSIPTH